MARSALQDPLTKYRWTVDIPGFSRLGFTACTVPSYDITAKTYAEGGSHLTPKSIVDKIDYKPITLSRGVTNDTSFNKWATGFIDLVTSNAALNNDTSDSVFGVIQQVQSASATPSSINSNNKSYRKDIKINHINRAGQVTVSYLIYGAYPISYKPASDFDAMGDDSMSIESITLAYDSFEVKYTGIEGFVGNILVDSLL